MHASLPDELTLHVFGFCSAKCLLTVEAASRALRDLRRHKTNDGLWCGLLRARWPREGSVLCSLRPRATARQLFRAFAMKRDARTQIMRRPERVVVTEDDAWRLFGETEANDDPDRLVFLVCVGRFAGLARWMPVPSGLAWQPITAMRPGLAWQPPAADTSYDIEIPQDVHTLSEEQIIERYGDELAQTLHVIDMQTHKCVTLVEDVVPWSINIDTMDDDAFPHSEVGDVTTYSSHLEFRSFRHNLMGDIDGDDLQELYHNDRLGTVGYTRIEHCILCPFLTLRPWNGQLRMHRAELEWKHAEYMTVMEPLDLREYLTDTIEQTHEEGWQRVPLREHADLADNRRDRTEEL
jgi:hypothetical protein